MLYVSGGSLLAGDHISEKLGVTKNKQNRGTLALREMLTELTVGQREADTSIPWWKLEEEARDLLYAPKRDNRGRYKNTRNSRSTPSDWPITDYTPEKCCEWLLKRGVMVVEEQVPGGDWKRIMSKDTGSPWPRNVLCYLKTWHQIEIHVSGFLLSRARLSQTYTTPTSCGDEGDEGPLKLDSSFWTQDSDEWILDMAVDHAVKGNPPVKNGWSQGFEEVPTQAEELLMQLRQQADGMDPVTYAAKVVRTMMDKLNEEQCNAVKMTEREQLSVITGAAGTGKTFTTKAVVYNLLAKGLNVCLAAQTGTAANKLQSTVGLPARTIHKTLGIKPKGDLRSDDDDDDDEDDTADPTHAKYNALNPLPTDVVLVDEASMVDLELFSRLIKALRPGTKLILVADHHQLPPVALGCPLMDLLEFGPIPRVDLKRVYRQGAESKIIDVAQAVKRGSDPSPHFRKMKPAELLSQLERATEDGDLPQSASDGSQSGAGQPDLRIQHMVKEVLGGQQAILVEAVEKDEVMDTAEAVLHKLRDCGLELDKSVKVITPTNDWRKSLNAQLQTVLNEAARQGQRPLNNIKDYDEFPNGIWLGDQVVQIKNRYDEDVFNGDFGRVVKVEMLPQTETWMEGTDYLVWVEYAPRFQSQVPHRVQYIYCSKAQERLDPAVAAAMAAAASPPSSQVTDLEVSQTWKWSQTFSRPGQCQCTSPRASSSQSPSWRFTRQ